MDGKQNILDREIYENWISNDNKNKRLVMGGWIYLNKDKRGCCPESTNWIQSEF